MKTADPALDRFRSLLQKAVRRGHGDLALTVCALGESRGAITAEWLEKRTAVIVFEECWPLGGDLHFTRGFHSKAAALMRVAGGCKIRDAAGLGFLAYAFSRGDATVLEEADADGEAALRRLAGGIHAPAAFWSWIDARAPRAEVRGLASRAKRYQDAGRPHDRAVMQAAALLAAQAAAPPAAPADPPAEPFPFWIVFDRHTAEGRRALRDVARDLHIPLPVLEWVLYLHEGSRSNAELPSEWWQRYCRWRFRRLGLSPEETGLVWGPARLQLLEALADDARRLKAEIYRWKLAHLERIESLRRQVAMFQERLPEVSGGQPELF
jgi:hypothetical protein